MELGGTTWDPQWDQLIELSLPPALLSSRVPRDVRLLCPHFFQLSNVDKRTFWAYFFQALAGAEAGLNPSANVPRVESVVSKNDTISNKVMGTEGLLQLTYEDRRRYGCDFDWKADKEFGANNPERTILRPKNNLLCGIKILKKQLIDQRKPLLSPTSYWSTLRPGAPGYLNFRRQMANVPAACELHASHTKAAAEDRRIARAQPVAPAGRISNR